MTKYSDKKQQTLLTKLKYSLAFVVSFLVLSMPVSTVAQCSLNIPVFELYDCNPNGIFYVDFELNVTNPSSNHFTVVGNGQNYGTFAYGETFYTVGPFVGNGTSTYEVIAFDSQNDGCSTEFVFTAPNCGTNTDCAVEIVNVQQVQCNNGQYYVQFEVEGNYGESTGFNAFGNGEFYNEFFYGQDSYVVGPFNGSNGQGYELIINDWLVENCSDFVGFEYFCEGTGGDCAINDISVQFLECSADEVPIYSLDFIPVNTTNEFFDLFINNQFYDYFSFNSLPIDLALSPTVLGVSTITICENDNSNCCITYTFEETPCETTGECSLSIPVFELYDCNPNGIFYVDFELDATNPSSSEFTVVGNGQNYGTFAYGETFYTVGPFVGNGTSTYEVIAFDSQNDGCSAEFVFTAPNCGTNTDCAIEIVNIQQVVCNNGQYYVQFEVEGNYGESTGFNAFGNGVFYSEFFYGQDSYIVGPFNGSNGQGYELIISDWLIEDCSDFVGFEYFCEEAGDCWIEVLEIFPTVCEDGQFYANIFIDYANLTGQNIEITGNGTNYGIFPAGQEFFQVGPFLGDGSSGYEFILSDLQNPNCTQGIAFLEPVFCGIGDCVISDVIVETGECNEQGTYNLLINFEYQDASNEFFDVIYNNQNLGFYSLDELPIIIENFNGNNEVETITICINDNPNCCASATFLTPQCEGLINVWPGDANVDNTSNNFDILNIGLAYGSQGTPREVNTNDWNAYEVAAWEDSFENGANYANADMDGNGIINADDAMISDENYNLTHGEVEPYVELQPNDNSPVLFVDLPESFELQQGVEFTAPIIFGSDAMQVENAYGLAFTLKYDPEIIDSESILIQAPVSWFGVPQTNTLIFSKNHSTLGEIDITLTKTDQNNTSGWGEILQFIGIIDNIAGKEEIFIEVIDVQAINKNEERFAVNTPLEVTTITGISPVTQLEGFDISPNPTSGNVFIKNQSGLLLKAVQIMDMNGRILRTIAGEVSFDISDLPAGVYIIKSDLEGVLLTSRLVLMD